MNRVRAIAAAAFVGLLASASCGDPLVVDETASGDRTYPSQFPGSLQRQWALPNRCSPFCR